MTTDKFNDSLNRLLDEGRLGYAIDTLFRKCNAAAPLHPDLSILASEADNIADTYRRLRQFLVEGKADPRREEVYEELKDRVRSLARRYLFIINEDRLDPLFSEYRLQKVRRTSVAEIATELDKNAYRLDMALETEAPASSFIRRREELVDSLFRKIWSLAPGSSEDFRAISSLLEGDVPGEPADAYALRAQIVSALLLGLLKFNDPDKFMLLLKAYQTAPDERIAARALTAIVLVLGRWGRSAISTPEIRHAVAELEDSILTYSRVRDVVMTLIKTRDTDRVSREVSDAFKSTMKEISPEMLEKLQREGLTIDSGETGMNPEWEKLMKNKELEERMKAINEMQLEGMDVMMQTFSRLKTFPFFRSVSNWFLPFSPTHSAVEPLFSSLDPEGFNAMADATDMCAGDRYSFAMGIMQMPEERRNMLSVGFGSQLEALRDLLKDRENIGRKPVFAKEALVFARDLYRFAKLFPKHKDFHDPFSEPIDFLKLPLLGTLLQGDDIILTSADFYFRHGYYPLALSLYGEAEASGDADRQLYEKKGFCRQMLSDFNGALEDYEKADLFSSDADRSSTWLLKKLAFCNKAVGRYERAAEYYERLLERDPDDLKTEFHLGSMLLRGTDMRRGKEMISKVHYMDPSHRMAERIYTRLKGHEAFMEERYSDALRLYEEARADQNSAQYHLDLVTEMLDLHPDADITKLKILLDF